MGSCLSKKSTCSSSAVPSLKPQEQIESNTQLEKKKAEEEIVKKEVFFMKHRKSHEVERRSEEEKNQAQKATEVVEMGKNSSPINEKNVDLGNEKGVIMPTPVRTSSCTKEEVDAILLQCGRLSRSSSTGKVGLSGSGVSSENAGNLQRGRKYSGSKRSFDFDNENGSGGQNSDGDNDGVMRGKEHRHRQSQRQSRTGGSASQGRRRTPSRERDQAVQQRSGSRERGGSGSGRRVSRSPGKRSESPITTSNGANSSTANSNNGSCRPGKMVSVPATVSSLAMDKSNNAGPGGGGGGSEPNSAAIKRIQVKRTAGGDSAVGSRSAASPRNRSPSRANAKGSNDNSNQNQPVSLSRSNSRKAEQSPHRRTPLSEIDTNIVMEQMPLPAAAGVKSDNNILSQVPTEKANAENTRAEHKLSSKKIHHKANCKAKEQTQLIAEESKGLQGVAGNFALNKATSGSENHKPQTITRSRSFRQSQDLDNNKPETPLNPTPSYTSILLEDIQSFHQKNAPTSAFTLPPSVTKACTILEAVADLNSGTGSNMFGASSDDRMRNHTAEQFGKSDEKTRLETKRDPIMESEVVANDDLIQPSFHKYVTVRRGMDPGDDDDLEEQESSGSNSFVGSQEHWLSSSWEPNSVDSTDRSTSLMSRSRQNNRSQLANQRRAVSELGH